MNEAIKKEKWYITLLAAIQFAHIVDFVVLMPLGPVLMRELNISPIQFATLVSSYNFSSTAFAILYSFFASRFDRKKILISCFIGFIIGTAMCGFAGNFEQLLFARILAGAFGGILNSIVMAIVADLIPYVRRGKAMSVIMSAFSIASIVGVPLGLAISDYYNWHGTFFFIAFFSVFILIASWISIPSLKDHIQTLSPRATLQMFTKILTKANYLKAYSFIYVINFSAFLVIPFISPYAVKNVGILESELKYLYLVGGLFTVISARVFGILTDKIGAVKLFSILTLGSTVPIYLYTHAPPMPLISFLAISVLFMSLISGRVIPAWTLISEVSSAQDRGTYMGLMNAIRSFGSATASLVAGLIVIEHSDGKILGFNQVGYLAIGLTILSIFIVVHIFHLVEGKLQNENTATNS